jgi:hypothetical protein
MKLTVTHTQSRIKGNGLGMNGSDPWVLLSQKRPVPEFDVVVVSLLFLAKKCCRLNCFQGRPARLCTDKNGFAHVPGTDRTPNTFPVSHQRSDRIDNWSNIEMKHGRSIR